MGIVVSYAISIHELFGLSPTKYERRYCTIFNVTQEIVDILLPVVRIFRGIGY
ncbi:hypothetical protein D3C71_1850860 [compost metagenome]